MSWGKFFDDVKGGLEQVKGGLDHFNQVNEWYKWYGWFVKYIGIMIFGLVVLFVLHVLERRYLHAKVDAANKNIEKVVELAASGKTDNSENDKIHAELKDIKKQLKSLMPPSRIKRPKVERKDEEKVKVRSIYSRRENDGDAQQQHCSDDIFMKNKRTKCE